MRLWRPLIHRNLRRVTRRQYSAEEKIRIVLEDLRGESSIAELCCLV
jgi:transposase